MHINTYYLVYAKSSLSTSLGIGVATPCAGIHTIGRTNTVRLYILFMCVLQFWSGLYNDSARM